MELFARTCDFEVVNTERIAARLFVLAGALVWVTLSLGASIVYGQGPGITRYIPPLLVTALAAVALLTGIYWENLAAALLFVGAAATIVWGALVGWEPGVWGVMTFFLIAPEVIAGALFLMAAQKQKVCEAKGWD
jgi:hypothetical protein